MLIVQCDFDDTITIGNVSTAIRTAFLTDNKWRQVEEKYLSGECSVEESNREQFSMMKTTEKDIEHFVLKNVVIREGFKNFVKLCQKINIRFVIVSSGLDLYIKPLIEKLNLGRIEVYSAKSTITPLGLNIKYTDPHGSPILHGFKDSFVKHFKSSGDTVVYIGDDRSDINPANQADFVIARSTLAEHMEYNSIEYHQFNTFDDVSSLVGEILKTYKTH